MGKKTVEKKTAVTGPAKQRGQKKPAPATARVRKYLSPKFANDLVEHMHRAKKAALQAKG